jgi:DNA-binding PadR family transcriptional regulator
MPTKSTSHFAILAMLNIRPMSAYELVRFAKESIGFFWNESYGNIHKHLEILASEGYIQLINKDGNGRKKKTYQINTEGKTYLNEWLQTPPDETILRDPLMLKVFSGAGSDLPKTRFFLQQEQKEMASAQQIFENITNRIAALDQDPIRKTLWLLTLRYGEAYAKTRAAWCQEAQEELLKIERNIL